MSPKFVPPSKFQELKGLDRISQTVHNMQCLWREISKSDLGIDGEIDVLEPRPDGPGAQATGKIIKVQAKSGQSYIKQDTPDGFFSPVSKDDLELWYGANYPVIFIVYHPADDKLYWKDIKEYVRNTPSVFQTPTRIIFDKSQDEFASKNRDRLLKIAHVSPPRVSLENQERLFSNLFLVQRSPSQLWGAPALTNLDYSLIQDILHSRNLFVPPFCVTRGMLFSFTDLNNPNCTLREFCDVEKIAPGNAKDWWSNSDTRRDYVSMLNRLLRMHAYHCGLKYNKEFKRFYFPRENSDDFAFKKTWTNARTKATDERVVVAYYEYGFDHFWRHLAADLNFKYIGTSWYLQIVPKYFFTGDGDRPWNSEKVGSYTTRQKARERNQHVMNHVLFWATTLSQGSTSIKIELDRQPILIVERMPMVGIAGFSITDDPATYEEPPEVDQFDFFGMISSITGEVESHDQVEADQEDIEDD